MTAFTDDDAAAAARSAQVRGLIDRAQSEDVFLTMLSAMDLCVLGGPKQALFDEAPTRAWASLRPKARQKLPGVIFDELEERGLLIRQAPTTPLAAPSGQMEPQQQDYAYSPALGVVMAARSRPAVAVTCELEQLPTRHPRLFALGDEQNPVQALVREVPVAPPPGDFPHLRKAGPLAWFYQYDLVSKPSAATFLAGWALLRSEAHPKSARLVTALRNDGARFLPVQALAIYTDNGLTARLDGTQYDKTELTSIMSGLLIPQG
jgi:hypothetical protein